ncbi:MAG: hypothetical protein O3A01_04010 [bacterium]|nr:hypothetical protein [bacterium]
MYQRFHHTKIPLHPRLYGPYRTEVLNHLKHDGPFKTKAKCDEYIEQFALSDREGQAAINVCQRAQVLRKPEPAPRLETQEFKVSNPSSKTRIVREANYRGHCSRYFLSTQDPQVKLTLKEPAKRTSGSLFLNSETKKVHVLDPAKKHIIEISSLPHTIEIDTDPTIGVLGTAQLRSADGSIKNVPGIYLQFKYFSSTNTLLCTDHIYLCNGTIQDVRALADQQSHDLENIFTITTADV